MRVNRQDVIGMQQGVRARNRRCPTALLAQADLRSLSRPPSAGRFGMTSQKGFE